MSAAPVFRWSKRLPIAELEGAAALLESLGHFAIVDSQPGHKTGELAVYSPSREDVESLRARHDGTVEEIAPEAWLSPPDEGEVVPIRIRDRFLVFTCVSPGPVEAARAASPDRRVLWFPPGLAFGTGDHATTASCLRLLTDEADRQGGNAWSMLDLGSGSGILAIAAHHLGAQSALGLEFDPLAMETSREYAVLNEAPGVELIEADAIAWLRETPARQHAVIAANLYSSLLAQVFPLLAAWLAEEGRVIFSGVFAKELPGVLKHAEACGFQPLRTITRGKWSAGLLARA